ncbi:MAG: Clp protease ClpP, partial [Allobaculum sp.]|nr:Clp protease ClpP [Allobaculum sp.]
DGLFCVESEVLKQIREANGEEIELTIDSIGGSLTAGINIYRALKSYQGQVVARVEGCACSAASMIMCAANRVEVYANSLVMIHGVQVSGQTVNASNVEKLASDIASIDQAIAEIYVTRTGKDEAVVRDWMNPEKWMSGKEAVALGFADVLREEDADFTAKAKPKEIHTEIGMQEVKELMNVTNKEKEKKCSEEETQEEEQKKKKKPEEDEEEKKEEVKAVETKKAVADALAQERKRLQEIDEIADMVPDKTLLKEAKYGSNLMTAQELSYRVLKQSQKAGAQFLNAWETEDSGAEKVQSLPTENVQATKELSAKAKEEALFKESLARFLKERGSN